MISTYILLIKIWFKSWKTWNLFFDEKCVLLTFSNPAKGGNSKLNILTKVVSVNNRSQDSWLK